MATAKKSAVPVPAAPAVHTPAKGGRTVTVACKVPSGLQLQLVTKTTFVEDTPSGSRERVRFDRVGARVLVHGPAYPNGQAPKGFPERPTTVGGYALTTIDREFWENWLEQNKNSDIVKGHMIFAHDQRESTKDKAKEKSGLKSGLEPLDVDGGDSRMPKPTSAGVGQLETAERG